MPIFITTFFLMFPLISIPLTFGMAIFGKESKGYYWFLFSLGLSMFGLYFRPDNAFDIVRYFALMDNIGQLSNPFQVFSNRMSDYTITSVGSDTNYLFNFFLWFIAKLRRPELLSGISIAVYYGGIGFVYLKGLKEKNDGIMALFVILSMLSIPIIYPISLVRFIFGVGVSFFINKWYFNPSIKPKISICLLIVPLFIHNALSLIVLTSLIIAIQKKVTFKKTIIYSVVGFGSVLLLISGNININIQFLQNILLKFDVYAGTHSQLSWSIMNGPGLLAIFSVLLFIFTQSKNENSKFMYYAFVNSILMSSIYLLIPPLSERYGWAIMPLTSWLVYEIVKKNTNSIFRWGVDVIFLTFGLYVGFKIFSQGFLYQVIRLDDDKMWWINYFSYFIFGK